MEKKIENQKGRMKKAVFLDRDGVINNAYVRKGKPYPPVSLAEFKLLPDVLEACQNLKKSGYSIVIVTNQPDVGRGSLSQKVVEEMHSSLLKVLPIDRIEVCYHPGQGLSDCICRKPLPGMLLQASKVLDLDLSQSWMIGDRFGDITCGQLAGCHTILIGGGYGEDVSTEPDFRAANLNEAVTIILNSI